MTPPNPLLMIFILLVAASIAFSYGCAREAGYGRLADVAMVASAAGNVGNWAFWDGPDVILATSSVIGTVATVALLLMANGRVKL